jgi:hypothetical protein
MREYDEAFTQGKDYLDRYQSMLEEMTLAEAEDHFAAAKTYDEARLAEELGVLEQLEDTEMKRNESKYRK